MFLKKFLVLLCCLCLMTPINPKKGSASIINPQKVYTYGELTTDLEKLRKKYPDELKIQSIGKTYFNNDIWAIKLGKGKRNVLLTGAHHGREWLTTNLLMEMLDVYTEAYSTKKSLYGIPSSLLDEVSIWFVPMVNPDGVTIQQKGIHSSSNANPLLLLEMNQYNMNFRRWKANGVGIDLNRQYPAGWENLQGTASKNSYQFYKGKKPLEAREVQALVQFTTKINPQIAIAYHSSGREIFWYYQNDQANVSRDKKIAQKISKLTGYPLRMPSKNATGGGYTDWFIQTFKRPAMTIEISYPVYETNPPLTVFNEEWNRNKKVGIVIANEAKKVP